MFSGVFVVVVMNVRVCVCASVRVFLMDNFESSYQNEVVLTAMFWLERMGVNDDDDTDMKIAQNGFNSQLTRGVNTLIQRFFAFFFCRSSRNYTICARCTK